VKNAPQPSAQGGEMNRNDIIRMAGHREVPPWVMKLVQDCVNAEREACAHMILSQNRGDSPRLYRDTLKLCAMLIKRRQNKLTKGNENASNC
jgi:hypothetical protein